MTSKISLIDTFCKYYKNPVYENIKNETWGPASINIASMLTMEQLNQFSDWFSLKPGMTILDICCGVGETTKYFAEKTNCKSYGIDINAAAINSANNLAKKNRSDLTFIKADIKNALPFANAYFDSIICMEAILYFSHTERLAILKECSRVLKPNGKLIYTDPCIISSIISDNELAERSVFGGYFFSPLGAQENLFEQSGFKLFKSEDITKNNCEAPSLKNGGQREKEIKIPCKDSKVSMNLNVSTILLKCIAISMMVIKAKESFRNMLFISLKCKGNIASEGGEALYVLGFERNRLLKFTKIDPT